MKLHVTGERLRRYGGMLLHPRKAIAEFGEWTAVDTALLVVFSLVARHTVDLAVASARIAAGIGGGWSLLAGELGRAAFPVVGAYFVSEIVLGPERRQAAPACLVPLVFVSAAATLSGWSELPGFDFGLVAVAALCAAWIRPAVPEGRA